MAEKVVINGVTFEREEYSNAGFTITEKPDRNGVETGFSLFRAPEMDNKLNNLVMEARDYTIEFYREDGTLKGTLTNGRLDRYDENNERERLHVVGTVVKNLQA